MRSGGKCLLTSAYSSEKGKLLRQMSHTKPLHTPFLVVGKEGDGGKGAANMIFRCLSIRMFKDLTPKANINQP